MSSILLGILVAIYLPSEVALHQVTRLILAWDVAVFLYLVLAMRMIFWSNHEKILNRALIQDEGQFVVLFLVIVAATVSLIAIFLELSVVKNMSGFLKYAHIALASVTILLSWSFTQVMFALHYAHEYHVKLSHNRPVGLDFPGDERPDYSDFLYFSCIIGTSGQTADISFSSRQNRRIGTIHCVLAFFFNTTVLALTINIASSLV